MREIYVTKASLPDLDDYVNEIKSMWNSHQLTNMGEKHDLLKSKLKEYLGVDKIDLLVNGHMAIELTLQALGLKGEVITTPYTFASTTHAIIRNGLEPVFCDVNPTDFTIDADKIENLITEKTCAILPVHVYGNVCNVERIQQIAKKYNLKVVYDAAHAFGETYQGVGVGNFGDASCFSFHATKVYNTIEGGAVAFHDAALGNKIYELKNFGIHGPEEVCAVGANAKMNEFCAAMGLCNLKNINADIHKRRVIYEKYYQTLDGIRGLQLNSRQDQLQRNYSYFPIIIDKNAFGASRDEVMKALSENGIYVRKYFYPITSAFSAFEGKYDVKKTPIALKLSQSVLTLPIYPDLSLDDVETICKIIMKKKGK